MLQTHEIAGIVDTRIESANPTTNYRSSDLGVAGGGSPIRSFILNGSYLPFYSFAQYDQIEAVKLYLTPKAQTGLLTNVSIKCAPITVAVDARFITWNNRTTSDTWSIPGALGETDINGLTTQSIEHSVGTRFELDITNTAKTALLSGKSAIDFLVWTDDSNAGFTYYSMEESVESRRPMIRIFYKGPQFSERLGSASMPSMPLV